MPAPRLPQLGLPAPRRGFALIVVMTLLALVVLMILSLVTMVQLSLQASKARVKQAEAETNALFAVNIALAKLQEYAGPDMRSTATADMGEPLSITTSAYVFQPPQNRRQYTVPPRTDANAQIGLVRPSPLGGTRYWTGVWGNAEPPGNVFKPVNPNNPVMVQPVLLNWLVSGNEFTGPARFNATNGQITASPGRPLATQSGNNTFNPTMSVVGLSPTSNPNSNITVNGQPAVLLVGANSSGATSGTSAVVEPARAVVAPLVNLTLPDSIYGSGSAGGELTIGRYAWWVGDEGVKASYNMRDTSNLSIVDVTSQAVARNRFQAAQRFGIEQILGFDKYPVNDPVLGRLTSPEQILLANGQDLSNITAINAWKSRYHDLTTYSRGVLANSQRGGLREDLTTLFEQTTLPAPLTGNILPDGTTRWGGAATPSVAPKANMTINGATAQHGLKWDILHNFYKAALPLDSTAPVEITPATNTTAGISPVVLQIRMVFSLYIGGGPPQQGQAVIYMATQFAVTLANPYAFPLRNSSPIDMSFMIDTDTKSEWGIAVGTRNGQVDAVNAFGPTNGGRNNPISLPSAIATNSSGGNTSMNLGASFSGGYDYIPILKNPKFGATGASVLDNVFFQVPANNTWAPGEAKTFMLTGSTGGFPASPVAGITPLLDPSIARVTKLFNALDSSQQRAPLGLVAPGSAVTAETYLLTQLGAVGAFQNEWGMLVVINPTPACTFEMRLGGSNVNVTNKGQRVLQRLINLDLTGVSVGGTDTTRLLNDSGYRHVYVRNGQYQPFYLNGIYIWLGLPNSPKTQLIISENKGPGGVASTRPTDTNFLYNISDATNYRTYADFNIRAANMAVPPSAPLNRPPPFGNYSVDPNNSGFPTTPPYLRLFDQGWDPDPQGNNEGELDGYLVTQEAFSKNLLLPKWGYSMEPSSPSNTILYDLPRKAATDDLPIISLGSLRHASIGADDFLLFPGYQPANPISNSWFSPFVGRTKSVDATLDQRSSVNSTPVAPSSKYSAYDMSYLLNTALWDRYFFSSILQSPSSTPENRGTPINERLGFFAGYTPNTTQLGLDATFTQPVPDLSTGKPLPKEMAPARYLMIDGAFNINSTSVEAWKAVLASLRGLALNTDQDAAGAAIKYTRLPRTIPNKTTATISMPNINPALIGASQPTDGTAISPFGQEDGRNGKSYAGFRRLTDQQITALAEKIVEQVRLRGPFLSLGQFVNRSLAPATNPLSLSGALQSAIDNTRLNATFGADGSMNTANAAALARVVNPLVGAQQAQKSQGTTTNPEIVSFTSPGAYPDAAILATATLTTTTGTNSSSGLNSSPATGYANNGGSAALDVPGRALVSLSRSELGSRLTGIPGWLTQADLLEALAPIISARSDTFVIRAYGESLDPLDGAVQSRAWCEAVVQRYPDYVDNTNTPSDHPYLTPVSGSTATEATIATKTFGRKFRIVSLRWLNQDNI